METQTQPRLTGAALFRKMLDNKKIIQAQMVEDYKNDPALQAAFKELKEINAREKELKIKKNHYNFKKL